MKTFLVAALAAAALFAADPAAGRGWWEHVLFLADDKLEGRETGSAGYRKAAEYVAGEFERAGLKAAGVSGYMQPVKFRSLQLEEQKSSVAMVRGGVAAPLKIGEALLLSATGEAGTVEGEAVFAGYGLKIPEIKYDDLAGLDLRGKIAVFFTGGPENIPGPLLAHAQSSTERWGALKQAGAIGMARILNPKSMDVPWERMTLNRNHPSMSLADPKLQDLAGVRVSMTLNPERAGMFFEGSTQSFEQIRDLAVARKALPRFPLGFKFRVKTAVKRGEAESPNVVALIEGSDPKLKHEYVVLSAHLDHMGIGQPIDADRIYNGAMDDASGVASLIEIARGFRERDVRLKRTIVFAAVAAEEKGLLGSRYFAVHPTVAADRIVANINMDMYLPIHPLRILTVYGLDESTLGDDIRATAKERGVEVEPDPEPLRNIFIRSDQYSFIRQGVPAVFFKFGYEKGSAEEKLQKEWLRNRYHAPSDDTKQPVDLEGAAKLNEIMAALTERVANAEARPAWKETSFFKRFALH